MLPRVLNAADTCRMVVESVGFSTSRKCHRHFLTTPTTPGEESTRIKSRFVGVDVFCEKSRFSNGRRRHVPFEEGTCTRTDGGRSTV